MERCERIWNLPRILRFFYLAIQARRASEWFSSTEKPLARQEITWIDVIRLTRSLEVFEIEEVRVINVIVESIFTGPTIKENFHEPDNGICLARAYRNSVVTG